MQDRLLFAVILLVVLGGCSSRIGGAPNLRVANENELSEGAPALAATSEDFYIYQLKEDDRYYVPTLHRSKDGKEWKQEEFPTFPAS